MSLPISHSGPIDHKRLVAADGTDYLARQGQAVGIERSFGHHRLEERPHHHREVGTLDSVILHVIRLCHPESQSGSEQSAESAVSTGLTRYVEVTDPGKSVHTA